MGSSSSNKKPNTSYVVLEAPDRTIYLSRYLGLLAAEFPEAEDSAILVDTMYGQMWKYEKEKY